MTTKKSLKRRNLTKDEQFGAFLLGGIGVTFTFLLLFLVPLIAPPYKYYLDSWSNYWENDNICR